MPKQIPIPVIINEVHRGYADAQKKYEEWSGGFWLWKAPEYLITISVAQKISKIQGAKYLTLEHGAASAIEDAGAKGKGRLSKKIREKGKVDILLWWGNGYPRGIIEIKNQIYSTEQYIKDVERIAGFLTRKKDETSLQFGLFAFYESADSGKRKSAIEKLNDRIDKVYQNSLNIGGSNVIITKYVGKIYQISNSAWVSACLLIKLT